jgi:hypothetical protein
MSSSHNNPPDDEKDKKQSQKSLTPDTLNLVFRNLTGAEQAKAASVSKMWKQVSKQDSAWIDHIKNDFGIKIHGKVEDPQKIYKDILKSLYFRNSVDKKIKALAKLSTDVHVVIHNGEFKILYSGTELDRENLFKLFSSSLWDWEPAPRLIEGDFSSKIKETKYIGFSLDDSRGYRFLATIGEEDIQYLMMTTLKESIESKLGLCTRLQFNEQGLLICETASCKFVGMEKLPDEVKTVINDRLLLEKIASYELMYSSAYKDKQAIIQRERTRELCKQLLAAAEKKDEKIILQLLNQGISVKIPESSSLVPLWIDVISHPMLSNIIKMVSFHQASSEKQPDNASKATTLEQLENIYRTSFSENLEKLAKQQDEKNYEIKLISDLHQALSNLEKKIEPEEEKKAAQIISRLSNTALNLVPPSESIASLESLATFISKLGLPRLINALKENKNSSTQMDESAYSAGGRKEALEKLHCQQNDRLIEAFFDAALFGTALHKTNPSQLANLIGLIDDAKYLTETKLCIAGFGSVSPFIFALKLGHVPVIEVLLQKGVNPVPDPDEDYQAHPYYIIAGSPHSDDTKRSMMELLHEARIPMPDDMPSEIIKKLEELKSSRAASAGVSSGRR